MLQDASVESVDMMAVAGLIVAPSIYPLSSPLSRALIISELLRTIFLFCVADDGEGPRFTDPHLWSLNLSKRSRRRYPLISEKEAPLLLAHVCRSWRITALDTPQLWACLHVHLPEYITTEPWFSSAEACSSLVERRLSAFRFWLKMSRNWPISIYFTVGLKVEYGSETWKGRWNESRLLPSEKPVATDFAQELLKHSHRWENVFLSLPRVDLLPFYDSLNRSFPLLKYLELDNSNVMERREIGANRDYSIYSTPRMKGMALCGDSSNDFVLIPDGLPPTIRAVELANMMIRLTQNLNGHQLTELVLFDVPLSDTNFARFPSVFPLLEELTLNHCICTRVGQGNVITVENRVVLEKLSSLKVYLPYMDDCSPLHWIVAPVLRHLTIDRRSTLTRRRNAEHGSSRYENGVILFLAQSGAFIRSFSYTRSARKSNMINIILNAMPSLVKLRYEGIALPSATIEDLSNPAYCPRLKSIHNEGHLPKGNGFASLYCPNVDAFSKLIERRCLSRRDADIAGGRCVDSHIRELAFPLHEAQEKLLRATRAFEEAEVRWSNTHRCGKTCPGFQ